MLMVELDIFSGRPNPVWNLSEKEESDLFQMIRADPTIVLPLRAVESKLGYRGFIVTADGPAITTLEESNLPSTFRINSASPFDLETIAALRLLDTTQKDDAVVDDELRNVVEEAIAEGKEDLHPDGAGMTCSSNYFTSSTNFDFWNANSYHRQNNNCYNYASNYRSNTFARPGRRSGQNFTGDPACSNVAAAVRADGYADACQQSHNISICLVIWPGWDFHFYRLCSGGRWCHKPGKTAATNRDDSGNYIYNPETCDRGDYTIFCEYFYSGGGYRPVQ